LLTLLRPCRYKKQVARIIQLQQLPLKRSAPSRRRVSCQAVGADEKDDQVEATIAQALYMVRMYAEILAMDETIIKRIRKLVAAQSEGDDRAGSVDNLRLVLAQLEKVGRRISYWNGRLRALLKGKLATLPSRRATKPASGG
jgi:hypothetical protein